MHGSPQVSAHCRKLSRTKTAQAETGANKTGMSANGRSKRGQQRVLLGRNLLRFVNFLRPRGQSRPNRRNEQDGTGAKMAGGLALACAVIAAFAFTGRGGHGGGFFCGMTDGRMACRWNHDLPVLFVIAPVVVLARAGFGGLFMGLADGFMHGAR